MSNYTSLFYVEIQFIHFMQLLYNIYNYIHLLKRSSQRFQIIPSSFQKHVLCYHNYIDILCSRNSEHIFLQNYSGYLFPSSSSCLLFQTLGNTGALSISVRYKFQILHRSQMMYSISAWDFYRQLYVAAHVRLCVCVHAHVYPPSHPHKCFQSYLSYSTFICININQLNILVRAQ